MSAQKFCHECGGEVPPTAPAGQCPRCMMKAGFESAAPGLSEFDLPSIELLRELFPQLEILALVGQGGMGAVYKARQPSLDRFVAVKVLPPSVGSDPTFVDRFTREARALARLTHPHIVSLYEFGETQGFYYFIMEYVAGANLREAIRAGKMQPEEALAIVPQICDALQFAHDEGIVHRDIKPENVLIDSRGRVKIADFGLAKLLREEQLEVALTHTNQVMGTLRYMAPEQMQHTHDVDHRADIYSLGVVFYELLTGDVPMGRFEPPSSKVAIDVRLDEVVLRALAQEPDKRYQHAGDVKTDVEMLARRPIPTIMRRDSTEERHDLDLNVEAIQREVDLPAKGLIAVGILTCLTAIMPIFVSIKTAHDIYDSRVTFSGENPPLARTSPGASTAGARAGSLDPPPAATPTSQVVSTDESAAPPRTVSLRGIMRYLALFVLALVLPTVGSLIIWGGWMMMQLRLRAVAAMAAVLALVPCQPVFILGPIFGIWSLVLLSRRQVKDGFLHSAQLPPGKSSAGPAEELDESATKIGAGLAIGIGLGVAIGTAIDNLGAGIAIGVALGIAFGAAQSAASPAAQESPPPPKLDENFQRLIRSRLKVPAIGLLLVGAVNLAAALAVLLLPVLVRRSGAFDEGFGFVEGASTFAEATFVSVILACCSLASGITLMVGAARMLDLQSHSIALTAAVVAILPVALGFPLSLPLGIWALLVLSRRDVKAVFGSWSS